MQLALAAPGKAKAGTVEVSDAAFGENIMKILSIR